MKLIALLFLPMVAAAEVYDCGSELPHVVITPHEVNLGMGWRFNYDIFETGEHDRQTYIDHHGRKIYMELDRRNGAVLTLEEVAFECRRIGGEKDMY